MKQASKAQDSKNYIDYNGLDARSLTRWRVMNCIRSLGKASRSDVATTLDLSPATLTSVTSGLMADGLIEEVTAADQPNAAKRGRPRVALRLKKGDFHVAGIKVSRDSMSILILDFDGEEIQHLEVPLSQPQMEPEALVFAIHGALSAVYSQLEFGLKQLSGICIGLAGQVDAVNRFVHWSSSLTRRNVDLGKLLDQHLPYAAFVDNDANLVAKAEQLFGEARGLSNFLVVTVEYGVGLGIVLGGRLHRGERGCGAEFGHTKVSLDGAVCQCGQTGCLEAYVGSYGLVRRAAEDLPHDSIRTVRDLIKCAEDGNSKALQILEDSGQVFALGIANLINLFDPERIIVSGAKHRIAHLQSDTVKRLACVNVINVDGPFTDIRVHHWDALMWARGAAAMGIEHVSALKAKMPAE